MPLAIGLLGVLLWLGAAVYGASALLMWLRFGNWENPGWTVGATLEMDPATMAGNLVGFRLILEWLASMDLGWGMLFGGLICYAFAYIAAVTD